MADISTGSAANHDHRRCAALRTDGEPCRAYALEGSRFCFWHSPDRAAERDAARSKGGKARHGRDIGTTGEVDEVELDDLSDVVVILRDTLQDTLSLENSLARSRAVAYLCNTAITALQKADLDQRLEAVEAILADRKPE